MTAFTYPVTTLAGSGAANFADGTGTSASFQNPYGVTADSSGNVYVADQNNQRIRKITSAGVVTTLAGSGSAGAAIDATGASARFNYPSGVAVDSSGNVFVADKANNKIRKVTQAGVVTTFAGSGTGSSTDGTGTGASFYTPSGVAIDSSGNLYVTDYSGHRIRKITPAGVVTTLAGAGTAGAADGTGTNAQFNNPTNLCVDSSGNVYVSDESNNRIRKITPAGVVTTLAGSTSGYADGTGTGAQFKSPAGVAVDYAGNVYVVDSSNQRIRKITPAGVVTTIAGSGSLAFADGTGTAASFYSPVGITVDSSGNLYVGDNTNNRIRKITPVPVAGTDDVAPSAPGVPTVTSTGANSASLSWSAATDDVAVTGYGVYYNGPTFKGTVSAPMEMVMDSSGNLVFIDQDAHAIRKLSPSGVITTFAGTPGVSGFVDATGLNAKFFNPVGLTQDAAGNLYVADSNNNRIRMITPAGVVTTLAGTGTAGFANGIGTAATFKSPLGLAVDSSGNIYVADTNNHAIRKIANDANRTVTTLAGASPTAASGMVDGTGTAARFNTPSGITIDSSNVLYVTDTYNSAIRKVTLAGVVTTFAGSTTSATGYADGAGTAATFQYPNQSTIDSSGNLYVADTNNHLIRKITPAGVVTTFAGTRTQGAADGSTSTATFSSPSRVFADSSSNVYISQSTRIRKISAGVVSTVAGDGTYTFLDASGVGSLLNKPIGVAVDSNGVVYVADTTNHRIRKITADGAVTTLAGTGVAGSTNGAATASKFNSPQNVVIDSSGNVYVADSGNHLIRKIDASGVVTTLAGSGSAGATNATGTAASFSTPRAVALDSSGNIIVSDTGNNLIRKISPGGVVTALAGSGTATFADGTGTGASFNGPSGLGVDSSGNVYVADLGNNRIRMVTSAGVVSTFAGTGSAGQADGAAASATFSSPRGIAVDSLGNVYVADFTNNRIRKITSAGVVSTLAGTPLGFADGQGTSAGFYNPTGVAVNRSNNTVYVADFNNNRIRKVTPAGYVTTLAGAGVAGYRDVVGTAPVFNFPNGVMADSSGNVYVADTSNNRIRKITPTGVVTTLAGSGTPGSADGTGTAASFQYPYGLAIDSSGNVYVSDQSNHRIRKITPAGVVSTFAGSGTAGFANGTGTAASFNNPWGLAIDSSGNLYVGDYSNHRIRKIAPDGNVTTFAGSGTAGFANGAASGASFKNPAGITIDTSGNIYVADSQNCRVRKIAPDGTVTTLAGSATAGSANGTGTGASFSYPLGVAVDSSGNVYVSDTNSYLIRKVTSAGVVTTLAGINGGPGFADATGTTAQFNNAVGIAVDSFGYIYVADQGNHVIRKISPAGVVTTFAGTPVTPGYLDSYVLLSQLGNVTSATIALPGPDNYSFAVRANDAAYNMSPFSGTTASTTVTNVAPDTTAPTAPGTPSVTNLTGTTATVTWTVSTDAVGVTAYDLYNGASLLASPATNTTTITVVLGTTYNLSVKARDAAGNVSAASSTYVYTPADTIAPTVPGTPTVSSNTQTSVTLAWTAATDNVGVTGYRVYLNGSLNQTVGNVLTATVTGLVPAVSNSFTVAALDAAGNASAQSGAVSFTITDTTSPSAPGTPTATAYTPTSVTLAWTAATDNVAVTNYRLVKDGTAGANLGNVLTTTVTGLTESASHTYAVQALDAAGNVSASSGVLTYAIPDTTPPTVPTPTTSSSGSTVTVSWGANSDATLFEVFRGGVSQGTTASNTFSQTVTDGTYSYTVRARDAAGNFSAQSSASAITVDTVPPTVPTVTATVVGNATSATITWDTNADAALYEVTRNGTSIGTQAGTSKTDVGLSDGTYVYRVRARDAAGNWSAYSSGSSVTVDTTPPAVPTVTASNTGTQVTVSWTSISDAVLYEIFRGGVSQSTTTGTSTTQTVSDGTYIYTVRAKDASGNFSAQSVGSSVVVDTTPPTVPTVTATVVGNATTATITWNTNSDAVLYEITRDGVSLGTQTGVSKSDTGLSDGAHVYKVRARDAAGNWSAYSSGSSVTVDTTPPTVPTVTASLTGDAVTVSWNTNADAALYEIFRNGASQGTTTSTTFTQNVVSDGTYSYTVRAKDAAGNFSAQSSASSVTRDTTPPAIPVANAVINGSDVTVSWVADSDATVHEILRNGTSQGTTTSSTFTQTLTVDGTYYYTVKARDAVGNWSAQSSSVPVTRDTTAPAIPTISGSLSGSNVTITWVADSDAALREVFRNGVSQGTTASASFTQTLTADGTYAYTVSARDTAGNWSAQSPATNVVRDTTPPGVPDTTVTISGSAVTVAWTADADAVSHEIFRDGLLQGTSTTSPFTQTLTTDGTYAYSVRAKDSFGNWSAQSTPTSVLRDTTPPAVPATPGVQVSDTRITVTWSLVTDGAAYELSRNGVSLGYVTGTTYVDSGMAEGTYNYAIRAKDTAGNFSAYSAAGMGVVADTTPPAKPVGLAATIVGDKHVTLAWTTDSDAAVYRIYRDGALVGTSSNGHFSEIFANYGNYTYTITGLDLHSNESVPSNSVVAALSEPASGLFRAPLTDMTWEQRESDDASDEFRRLSRPDGDSSGGTELAWH